ncbi:MAG TPA: DUF948 domain-containing protein [Candidatus Nanopelagicaceae bacterium]|nr:DUF948 domain-containing protein [Candidatus Nanopelagicaceae bacterium]
MNSISWSDLAGLVAAGAFLILVLALAIPVIKLGKVMDESANVIKDVGAKTLPLIGEVTTTVTMTNAQLERVDAITKNVQDVSEKVSSLSHLVSGTVSTPIVKFASLAYGLKRSAKKHSRKGTAENSTKGHKS